MKKLCVVALLAVLMTPPAEAAKKDKIRHYPVGGIKGWYVVMLNATTDPSAFDGTIESLAATYKLNVTWSVWRMILGSHRSSKIISEVFQGRF